MSNTPYYSHSYHVNGNALPLVDSIRDIGINVDDRLKFDKHIALILHKAMSECRLIKCFHSRNHWRIQGADPVLFSYHPLVALLSRLVYLALIYPLLNKLRCFISHTFRYISFTVISFTPIFILFDLFL